ncbi:MAG: LysM peptidoglycan-binding domain-containing protein [Acetatifactor sp.]
MTAPQPRQSPAPQEITDNPVSQDPVGNGDPAGNGDPSETGTPPDQPQESLNPDAQDNANPQEVPAQGPSVADIEAQQPQPVSYVIQPGDTLTGISIRQYGNDSHVQAICELNGIANPDNIQTGQKILLP